MLPERIKLSQKSTDKLRGIKGRLKSETEFSLNILARIALMLAINESKGLKSYGVSDSNGPELKRSVLFGEHEAVYDVIINQYIHDHDIDLPVHQAIAALIEVGVHKMGHIKSIEQIYRLN